MASKLGNCKICNGKPNETNCLCHYKTDKLPVGRPKKAPTCKPALRTDTEKWAAVKAKYPNQTNKMFNEWVDSLLKPQH